MEPDMDVSLISLGRPWCSSSATQITCTCRPRTLSGLYDDFDELADGATAADDQGNNQLGEKEHHQREAAAPDAQREALRHPPCRSKHHQDGQGVHHPGRHRLHRGAAGTGAPNPCRLRTDGSTAVVKAEDAASTGSNGVEHGAASPGKKMRRTTSASSINGALCSGATQPVQILELEVTQVAEELIMVNMRHGNAHEAIAKVCEALESLCLKVISTSITAVASGIVHNLVVETEGLHGAQSIKEMLQTHSAILM
ncbi:hypothetical protein ZWY2020_051937 [Hordeum vulgare]|nr:hypothetical protein ZWY2020_051937 [Hordeum vulgare]